MSSLCFTRGKCSVPRVLSVLGKGAAPETCRQRARAAAAVPRALWGRSVAQAAGTAGVQVAGAEEAPAEGRSGREQQLRVWLRCAELGCVTRSGVCM